LFGDEFIDSEIVAPEPIIEEGNQDMLLKEGIYYKNLYSKYFRHQSLEYIESH